MRIHLGWAAFDCVLLNLCFGFCNVCVCVYASCVSALLPQPKKSAKLKPRPPVGPRACTTSVPTGRHHHHHHRLLRVHPQGGQSHTATTSLPPIENQQQATEHAHAPAPSFSAAVSAHMPLPPLPDCASDGQAVPLFASSSCYMLQGDEPWKCQVSKVRPPPKVSRLDLGGSKLAADCLYPPPPVCPSAIPPEGFMDDSELKGSGGLALLNEAAAAVAPLPETQSLVPLGDLVQAEPLSLELPSPKEGAMEALGAVAEQLPSAAPLLSQAVASSSAAAGCGWDIGAENVSDGPRLSTLHLPAEPTPSTSSSASASPSNHRLLQPFDFTGASLRSSPLHCHLPHPDDCNPHAGSPMPPLAPSPAAATTQLGSPLVDVHSKRPGVLSRMEARDITKMANKAAKEPLGSLSSTELLASLARRGVARLRDRPSGPTGSRVLERLERLERICGPDPQLQARLQASLQELHQDLLRRICPLQRLAASHPVSPAVARHRASVGDSLDCLNQSQPQGLLSHICETRTDRGDCVLLKLQ